MPSPRYKTILLFGPPGVGKGTQGKLLGQVPGFIHLATGDIFRALDKLSPLGRKFIEYSSRGELVPDEVTLSVWRDHVANRIKAGTFNPQRDILLLDGIPRSLAQAKAMDEDIDVLGIVHLKTPDLDEMVQRMKRRAEKEGRHDDADEKVIRRRFDVYAAETAPVLGHYAKKLIKDVDAMGSPADVLRNILAAVTPLQNANFKNPLGGS